jgi:hypothetical protein
MRIRYRQLVVLAVTTLVGCLPDVEDTDTLVREPRVLAVSATPAEVGRNQSTSLSALYADASGNLQQGALDWAFCSARKPLAELGPISPSCLDEQGDALEGIGEGLSVEAKVPMEACRLFGPDRPPPKDGEPAGRPVDPDPTGGYYQPLRLFDRDQDAFTLFELRVSCNLPNVGQTVSADFVRRYRRNQNPALDQLVVVRAGDDALLVPDDPGSAFVVKPGATLSLRARWTQCESGDDCGDGLCGLAEDQDTCPEDCTKAAASGCGGSERYLYFDLVRREFRMRREGLRLSWFSSAGSFAEARTGHSEADADQSSSDNRWTAPEGEGDVSLWVVLRDDRGGSSFTRYALRVER